MGNYALLIILFSQLSYAQVKSVFMSESVDSKQITLKHGQKVEQVTEGDKWHLYPDISPDSKTVVFVEGEGEDRLYLVVKDLDSKNRYVFKFGAARALHPRFSKNMQYLVFSLQKENEIAKIVYFDFQELIKQKLVEVDDDHERIFYPKVISLKEELPSYFPSFSSENLNIYYQRNRKDGVREVIKYSLLDDSKTILLEGMAPALSADENIIAYTKKIENNWDIYTYNQTTKETNRVTYHEKLDYAPSFDHYGNLFFSSNRRGNFDIYQIKNWDLFKKDKRIFDVSVDERKDLYAVKLSGNIHHEQKKYPKFPTEARSSFGHVSHNGFIYIVGGHQGQEHTYPPESFQNETWRMNIETGEWKKLSPRHHKAHGFQVIAHENYLYAFGGFAYSSQHKPKWKSLSVVERYNINDDKWEIIGHMPRPRSSYVALKVFNRVYIVGGWNSTPKFDNDFDGTFFNEIDVFDLANESFETLEEKLPLKRRAFSGVTFNNKLYFLGGISEGANQFSLLDNVTVFDPVTKKFHEETPLPFATFAPAAGVSNNNIYIFGGMFKTGKFEYLYVSHIYKYTPIRKKWYHTGRYLSEAKGFSGVVDYKDSLIILGGHTYLKDQDKPVNTVEYFR